LDGFLPAFGEGGHGSSGGTFRVDAPVHGIHIKNGWVVCAGDVLIKDLALRAGVIGAILVLIVGRAVDIVGITDTVALETGEQFSLYWRPPRGIESSKKSYSVRIRESHPCNVRKAWATRVVTF
jgi:hypothetical protein